MNAQIKVYVEPNDIYIMRFVVGCYVDYEVVRNVATYQIGEQRPCIRAISSEHSLLSNIEYGTMDLCF